MSNGNPFASSSALVIVANESKCANYIKLVATKIRAPDRGYLLRNILTTDQIQMLGDGSLDIGFLRLPIGEHPELDVVRVHREPFVVVTPLSHKLAKRKRVALHELSGQDFVMYERSYAPGFHDLIFGMLRDAGVIPNVCQTAGQMPTLISLVDSGMGISILPASAVKHSGASVVACEIGGKVAMSEIAIAVNKGNRAAAVGNFRSLALKELGQGRISLHRNRR